MIGARVPARARARCPSRRRRACGDPSSPTRSGTNWSATRLAACARRPRPALPRPPSRRAVALEELGARSGRRASSSRWITAWASIITPRSSWYSSPSSTWSVVAASRSRLRTFCDFAYVQAQISPSRTTYQSGIRCGQPRGRWSRRSRRAARRGTPRPPRRSSRSDRAGRALGFQPRRIARRASRPAARLAWSGSRRPPIASAASRTAARASSGSSTTASPASLSTSRTSQSTPAKPSSTITAPSSSSATTVRSSRAQRARSGEIQTRARREAGTSPVRGQPSTSAAGSTSGRGSNRSSVTVADLIRSSRKWRTLSRAGSKLATYQPSRPLISA